MEKIANSITDFYAGRNHIPEDMKEIYAYGFQLIIADIINFAIILLISLLLRCFVEGILFLITLCGIRQFSGGFHAKTFWQCRLSMVITFLAVLSVSHFLSGAAGGSGFIIIGAACVAVIGFLAPTEHPNKPLTESQRKNGKIKAVIVSLIFFAASVVLPLLNRDEGVIISITLAAVVILMLIGIAAKKGGYYDVS